MSTTTPGSEPERRDEASEPTAPAETGEVHPAGAPEAAERIERVEQADVPPPEPAEPEDDTVAFIGTEEAVAEAEAEADAAAESDADAAAAARLDDAINRANADAAASEAPAAVPTETTADEYPAPVPADSVRRETYVPAATVAAGTAAGAATLAPEPAPVAPAPAPQAIYVQAPVPPKRRGNRGFGVLVGLIATAAFAVLYAGAAFLLLTNGQGGVQVFTEFLVRPVFWVPVIAFFVAFAVLALILNTSAWWTWAVFGLLIGVFVYFSYTGGALLTVQAWTLTLADAQVFIAQRWLDPFAIVAAVIARELPIWFGGWIAAHGRTVVERNRVAREEYDRMIAAGPKLQPRP